MVTDEQFRDLVSKYNELSKKYKQMSEEISSIKLRLDIVKTKKNYEQDQQRKDVTRYLFMQKQFKKRQLVLACIHQYVKDNQLTDSSRLFELFPDFLQGSMGVIRSAEEAERYTNATEHYFFKDDEVLHLDSGIFVVSKDWTIKNIDRFIDRMTDLGYVIEPIERV